MRLSQARAMRALAGRLVRLSDLLAHWALSLRGWHPIAGADGADDDQDGGTDDDKDGGGKDDTGDSGDKDGDKPLAAGGLKALQRERDARRALERRLAKLEGKDKPDEKADDAQKPDPTATVTAKVRRANLKAALADEGITGARAKAVAKLVRVNYDDDDEPTNLADALEAAESEYGKELVRGRAKRSDDTDDDTAGDRRAPLTDGGQRQKKQPTSLTAEELAITQMFGMTAEQYVQYKALHPDVAKADPATAPAQAS